MADYSQESFKNCLFNPFAKDLTGKYPALKDLLPQGEHGEKVLKYILFLYDPKSPFIRDIRNIKTRKQEAAKLAGFDLQKDSDFLDSVYSFKNKEAAAKAIKFLKEFIHDRTWSMIVSHEQTFYEYNERLMKPVEDDKDTTKEKDVMATIVLKSKLVQDLKEIHTILKEYYKEIFEDDDLREQVINNRISPETMARV
jgi:hypothetical protein